MVFTDEDKATRATKFLWGNKHYGDKRLQKEFPTKNRSLRRFEENRQDIELLIGASWCAAMTA